MIYSMHVRVAMATSGRFITTFPSAVMRFSAESFPLKRLPVNLADRPFPLAIVTLKNRTLSPVVERFIEYLRDFTQQMRADEMAAQR
jgi:DNA-binding transcriptional LysR family regulator